MLLLRNMALLSLAMFSANTTAKENFLCVAELTTGFSFDKAERRWRQSNFRSDKKLTIVRAEGKSYAWQVNEIGSAASPDLFCSEAFSKDGALYCQGIGKDLHFSKTSLRFLYTYHAGYWGETALRNINPNHKEGDDTPAITIGRCTPI